MKKQQKSSAVWTPELTKTLGDLWSSLMSPEEITSYLNSVHGTSFQPDKIRGKLSRMGMSLRGPKEGSFEQEPMQAWANELDKLIALYMSRGASPYLISKNLQEKYSVEFNLECLTEHIAYLESVGADYNRKLRQSPEVTAAHAAAINKQAKSAATKEVREAARLAIIVDALTEAVSPLEFTPPKPHLQKGIGAEEHMVLCISDVHFGTKNEQYNIEVAKTRVRHIFESAIDIAHIHKRAYPIKHIHCFFLGDIPTGEIIFPSQPHEIDQNALNQVFGTLPTLVECEVMLASEFETVSNATTPGNHGRLSKFMDVQSNLDNFYYHALKAATANIPNISWNISPGWYNLVKVLNTKFLLIHGHQIKMTMNLPWYGITTRLSRWATSARLSNFDVACMGHFHVSSKLQWGGKQLICNGTTVSGDEFALEKLGLESTASQWLFGVHPKRGITWSYELGFE